MPPSRLVLSALLVPLALAPAPALPGPAREPVPYFPVRFGTTWVYQEGDEEMTQVISGVRKSGGVTVVTVSHLLNGQTYSHEKVEVSAQGVARLEWGSMKFDQPMWLLKLPARAGDSWTTNSTLRATGSILPRVGSTFKGTKTVIGEEQVKVPAGSFLAARVRWDYVTNYGGPEQRTSWYARGVGLVKMETDGRSFVLKSFTPGK